MDGGCCGTRTVGQAEHERDEVDVPEGVEGGDLRQDQHERPKDDNKFIKLHHAIWPRDQVYGLQKRCRSSDSTTLNRVLLVTEQQAGSMA
ncbi:hypothetical protein B296_00051722 [Ensete ventricosum]|uniref:Uncharacterized protein n=1 Tax=Ensete ventricosum TaxID=4639 RepID=A0A426WZA3_ENSVE|nr:hypothetical protein B296_00051722 [Ensete ventricosum]